MSGTGRAKAKPRRLTLEERIKDLQAKADAKKKVAELRARIDQAKKDLKAMRLSRR